jgi:membrane protein YqaA with SNARE-associated domain
VKLVLGTFLYSIASALIPVLNAEIPLAGLSFGGPHALAIAIAAAAGQTVGKIIWYFTGIHSMKIPWLARKMETEKWKASYEKWNGRIAGRPVTAGTFTFVSAVTGFPPLAIISVLAGSLRMNLPVFVVTVLVGRTIRFWAVIEGASVLKDYLGPLVGIG